MRLYVLTIITVFVCVNRVFAQIDTTSLCPIVTVTAILPSDTFKFGKEILVKITLTNKSNSIQSVWFDKPKSSTGGPAWTSVMLTNKRTGQSVLKYENKAILQSQLYSLEDVESYSYKLKPSQAVSGHFRLLDLVVLLDEKRSLDKGNYQMQVFYCDIPSSLVHFTVE